MTYSEVHRVAQRRPRILVLEEDVAIERALEDAGFLTLTGCPVPPVLVRTCELERPDLCLLDLTRPTALEQLGWLQAARMDPPVVVIAEHFDRKLLATSFRLAGYLVRPFLEAQLVATVVLATSASAMRDGPARAAELADLSPRERQVLGCLLDHRRPPTIARDLGVSPNTVRNHLKSIFFKLGVNSQQELLDYVLSHDARPEPALARQA